MTQRDNIIRTLELKEPDYVPVFEWMVDANIINHITGGDDILKLIAEMGLDGVAFRPDYRKEFISKEVFIDEWGCKRKITNENYPIVIETPIKNIKDYKSYKFPDPYADHRFDRIARAMKRFGNNIAVILSVRDIFSDIRDLVGYENALISLITEWSYFEKLLNRCIEYNRTIARIAYEKYNINILVTTDDIAGPKGLIFSPKLFFEFLGPKFREIIRGFKNIGYYCIKHCDGDIMQIIDYFIDSGIDCIDPIDPSAGMNIGLIKKEYGKRVCIKGNINCLTTLVTGTENDVEEEVKQCIKCAARGGGYILSSSNTIHSGVQPKNFEAMVRTARQYGRYPL